MICPGGGSLSKFAPLRCDGCCVRRQRFRWLKDLALSVPAGSFCTIFTNAVSSVCWGATLEDRFFQGVSVERGAEEGVNWKRFGSLSPLSRLRGPS